MPPEEVERLISFPVEYALGGLLGLEEVRSVSKFGLSQVVAIFEDGTDIYFARQQIDERLGEAQLPAGIARPSLGPVATGLGEVYHYLITSDVYDLTELRTLQDWVIRPTAAARTRRGRDQLMGGLGEAVRGSRRSTQAGGKYRLTLDDVVSNPARKQRRLRRRHGHERG